MTEKKKKLIERELQKIEKQLDSVSGVKRRHELLKKQRELKKDFNLITKRKI